MKKIITLIALLTIGVVSAQDNYRLGENYLRQGEFEKAAQVFSNLLKRNPFNTNYLKRLVTCYQEIDQFQKSDSVIRSSLKQMPSQFYLHVELGYNYERQQKKDLAKIEYEIALNAIDQNPNIGGMVGRMFRQNNSLDNAILAYEKTMSLNPNASYEFQVAQIYGEKGDFSRMFNSYINLVDKNENYIGSVQRLSGRYITDDPSNENNIALKKALLRKSVSNPKNVWNEMLSWLFSRQKEYSKAFIQEKALFKRDPAYLENIITLGRIAFNDKDYNVAKSCYSFILKNTTFIDEKLNAELYLLKIAVELEQEDTEALFKNVLKVYGENRNTIGVQVEYANYLTFVLERPDEAEMILEKSLTFSKSKFQQARIKLKLGEVLVFTGRFNKALIYFSQVQTKLKNHPLSQEARFKVAQTSYFKGDFDWATAQLKVLKGSTSQLIANDAAELFLIISDNKPQDSIPSGLNEFAKADLLAFQNRNENALKILKEIQTNYRGFPVEDEAFYKEAKILIKQKKFDRALQSLMKLIEINAEGILIDDAYYTMAEIYNTELNLPEKAKEYYQKIIFEYPSSIYLVDSRKKYRELRGDRI